ncbi:hypothetical protein [Kosakonia sp. 1610]|mgnify:CR=1 FL=1|uniref:hypothetical protein n=1 Tax=Kosakonia sp. 1610 TaxID=3156426 RepID=UPI003D1BA2CF
MFEGKTAREIIAEKYSEFPETLLHAELCRACARADGRSVKQALRGFSFARRKVVTHDDLKHALKLMHSSMFPETEITTLRAYLTRLETALVRGTGAKRKGEKPKPKACGKWGDKVPPKIEAKADQVMALYRSKQVNHTAVSRHTKGGRPVCVWLEVNLHWRLISFDGGEAWQLVTTDKFIREISKV